MPQIFFVSPTHGTSTTKFCFTGQAVLGKMFEHSRGTDGVRQTNGRRRTENGNPESELETRVIRITSASNIDAGTIMEKSPC